MAKTKTVAQSVTRVQNDLKGITLSTTDSLDFANEINEIILKAHRWDFMIKEGTGFGTTDGTQDYSQVPADFLWLHQAWVQDDSSVENARMPLDPKDSLASSTEEGLPRAISVEQGTKFRLFPVPSQTRSGAGPWLIDFEYYKLPIRLTATANTFEFDDAYWEVFTAGLLARAGQFLDDARAGQWLGRDPSGAFRGSGWWGDFAGKLNEMIASDNRTSSGPVYAPLESLYLG